MPQDGSDACVAAFQQVVRLGCGVSGTVSLCVDPANQQLYAVKRIARSRIKSKANVDRVLSEKAALQALASHLGIINLHFTSKDSENLYFVMEPALGGPLHRHIRGAPRGCLEARVARFYAAGVTAGVGYLQKLGYAHRDLKASNIVLGPRGYPKITDLGCATLFEPAKEPAQPRCVGTEGGSGLAPSSSELHFTFCGTPHCMAPEMASRAGHTAAVDWWALGILIHEMLVGAPPFGYGDPQGGAHAVETLLARVKAGLQDGDLDRLTDLEGNASQEEDCTPASLVRQLLQVDPKLRLGYAGVQEVQAHGWFAAVEWDAMDEHTAEPPDFRRDLGELEAADKAQGLEDCGDPNGVFAGF